MRVPDLVVEVVSDDVGLALVLHFREAGHLRGRDFASRDNGSEIFSVVSFPFQLGDSVYARVAFHSLYH